MKKTISVLLVLAMILIAMPIIMVTAVPKGQAISSAADFKNMKATTSYYLTADITITEPYTKTFYGTFDGNGHSITVSGPAYVFKRITGTLKNLTVKGNINVSSDSEVAGVAAYAGSETTAVTTTFENVVSEVNITASGYASQTNPVGGIVSRMNKGTVSFVNCKNKGNITLDTTVGAATNVGGILGFVTGADKVTFTNCVNEGNISSKQLNAQIGGIAGYVETWEYNSKAFALEFDGCQNKGEISACSSTHMGVGGIVGCVHNRKSPNATTTIKNCANLAKISSHTNGASLDMGGMIGRAYAMAHLYIENCTNSGELNNAKASSWSGTGGMVGNYMTVGTWGWSGLNASKFTIKNSTNSAKITGINSAGMLGAGMQLGVEGISMLFDSCVNIGGVYAADYAGGIAGAIGLHEGSENLSDLTVKSCYNSGFVRGRNLTGGIVGYMAGSKVDSTKKTTIDSCVNIGDVKCGYVGEWPSSIYVAGIIAKSERDITVTGCVNMGKLQPPTGATTNLAPITPKGAKTVTASNNLCLDSFSVKEPFATVKADKAELAAAVTSDALAIDDSALWSAFDEVVGLQGENYTQFTWERLVRFCDTGAKLLDPAQTPFNKLKQKDINKAATDIVKAKNLLEDYVAE